MASRYKRINDINYDRAIVEIAEKAVAGSKSNSLAAGDCGEMIELVKQTGTFSKSEKKTLEYVYESFDFSGKAKEGFRKKIDSLFDEPVKKAAPVKKTKSVSKKTSAKKKAKAAKKKTETKTTAPMEDVVKLEEKVEEKLYSPEPSYEEPVLPPVREEEKEGKGKAAGILAVIAVLVIGFVFFFDNIKSFFTAKDTDKKIEQKKAEPVKGKPVEDKEAAEKKPVPDKKEPVKVIEQEVPAVDGEVYIIQPGDKLVTISKRFYGNFSDWKIIYRANKNVIKNPTLIYPGHKIVIPKK